MTTQKMLSTITLLSLHFFPLHNALAATDHTPSGNPTSAREPGASVAREPDVRRPLAIGFAESAELRALLRGRLAADRRYALSDSQQIPADPSGLFLGGFVSEMKAEHGWMSCRARYFVAGQPEFSTQVGETAAALVPLLQVKIFRDRPERLALAEQACLEQLADQIADDVGPLTARLAAAE